MTTNARIALALLALGAFARSAAAQPLVTLSTGVEYSSGKYGGSTTTEVVSAPLVARLSDGKWALRVSTAYLQVMGDADVADNVGATGDTGGATGPDAQRTVARMGTARGIGDTTIAVTRSFRHIRRSHVYADLTARVRLPTGDEGKGLGVGATDYALAGELGVSAREGGAYVNVARRYLGDRAGFERQDGWQASIGGWVRANERTTLSASYFWRESSFGDGDEPSELGANISYKITEQVQITVNAGAGLSDASPDTSVGVRLSWSPRHKRKH